jgi:hypothetical protein
MRRRCGGRELEEGLLVGRGAGREVGRRCIRKKKVKLGGGKGPEGSRIKLRILRCWKSHRLILVSGVPSRMRLCKSPPQQYHQPSSQNYNNCLVTSPYNNKTAD